jgi:hypothetical protein
MGAGVDPLIISRNRVIHDWRHYDRFIDMVKFVIRAKNDILWIPAGKSMGFQDNRPSTYCSCENERFCVSSHILNNCSYHKKKILNQAKEPLDGLSILIIKHFACLRSETTVEVTIKF